MAEQKLPLTEIGTRASLQIGISADYQDHFYLACILQQMSHASGKGINLIKTGLTSPVIKNRFLALEVLQAWNRDDWSQDLISFLRQSSYNEPNQYLKSDMQKLLDAVD
ncbi:MAG: hypothetical protein K0S74_1714 [Chlamydiales bacterium]|nr:hypothetical protein [Chlamydiales bacterium]